MYCLIRKQVAKSYFPRSGLLRPHLLDFSLTRLVFFLGNWAYPLQKICNSHRQTLLDIGLLFPTPYTNNKHVLYPTRAIGNPCWWNSLCKTVLYSLENLKNNLGVIYTQFLPGPLLWWRDFILFPFLICMLFKGFYLLASFLYSILLYDMWPLCLSLYI